MAVQVYVKNLTDKAITVGSGGESLLYLMPKDDKKGHDISSCSSNVVLGAGFQRLWKADPAQVEVYESYDVETKKLDGLVSAIPEDGSWKSGDGDAIGRGAISTTEHAGAGASAGKPSGFVQVELSNGETAYVPYYSGA